MYLRSRKQVPGEGFEPSRVAPPHFECGASAISPPRQWSTRLSGRAEGSFYPKAQDSVSGSNS